MKHTTILSLCALAHLCIATNTNATTLLAGSGHFDQDNQTLSLRAFDGALGTLERLRLSITDASASYQVLLDIDLDGSGSYDENPFYISIEYDFDFEKSNGETTFIGFIQAPAAFDNPGIEFDDGDNSSFFVSDGGPDEVFIDTSSRLGDWLSTPIPFPSSALGDSLKTQEGIQAFFTGTEDIEISFDFNFGRGGVSRGGGVEYHNPVVTAFSGDYALTYEFTPAAVPEPETYVMICGVVAMAFVWIRKRAVGQR